MYTLYKSTNNLTGRVFVGIESNNKLINMNLDYFEDLGAMDEIGDSLFTKDILKRDIQTIEDAYDKRNKVVSYFKKSNINVYNIIDNSHIDQNGCNGSYQTLSKMYTFIYVVSNDVNNKLYVGSHTTDRLNDGYIGSGRSFIEDVNKIGKSHFKRTIIQFCETHQWAKLLESTTIKELQEQGHSIYNRTSAGFGGNYGSDINKRIAVAAEKRWDEEYDFMMLACHNPEATAKRSESLKYWIANNQELHMERMMKINTNPEKIRKTAEKHRGMKRTEETCNNISNAMQESFARRTEDEVAAHVGKDMLYVTSIIDYTYKRVTKDYILQENEMFGMIRDPKLPLKKAAAITNILTWEESIAPAGYILKPTERKGNRKYVRKAINEGKMI